jgi:hypothetical protein
MPATPRTLRGPQYCRGSMMSRTSARIVSATALIARLTPPRRKTRFQPLVRRYWTGFYPQGSYESFQSAALTSRPPFPSFAWRNLIDRRAQFERSPRRSNRTRNLVETPAITTRNGQSAANRCPPLARIRRHQAHTVREHFNTPSEWR